VSLIPPITVGKLQTALHTKAKNSPDYRFYALYDKLYRRDILEWALVRCRNNRGAPGVDGQSFADIETYGRDQWLDELTEELRNGTYRPRPVRRVYIPKGDGKLRPLGIPCIKDRVVQMAAVLVLEPIFRGRSGAGTTRLPPGAQRLGRRSPSGTAAQDGAHRRGGRGPLGLLR
jgi:RNA-directed DNA polymerase